MVLREHNDPLNQSRGIMGPLGNSAVQNNRGRLRQRFDLIRKLGQGTYGKVQLGIDKETGQEVAIKTIKKSKIETEADLIRIRREIQIMSSVRHPNIIHIYEVFENREKMVLVMEYAAGGELYDYLNDRKILQEDEARRIFRQIASAVYYCHKHKICHRDLKLENILLDESANAKIADFGLSNVFDDVNLLKTFCGSPLYASPEIVRGTPYFGPEVDCWSLGVLLYTLVYGAMPFDGSNFKRLVKQISNGDYYEPKKPAEASLLIRRMLTVDPIKRASIKDVCAHPWINQGFDKECLSTADELANQSPVRLDVLLSVAPAYSINHSQVVIACDQGDGAEAGASGGAMEGAAGAGSDSLITSTEHKKPRKDSEQPGTSRPSAAPIEKPARPSLNKDKDKHGAPPNKEVKRKAAVKKKSKSSPILELIVDEEEEMEKLEPLDDRAEDDDDDAGDTLSEISEIQTIAEDIKDMAKSKSKLKVKSEEQKKVEPVKEEKKEEPAKEKTVQQAEAPPAAPAVVKEVRKKPKTEAEPKPTDSKEKQPSKSTENKEPQPSKSTENKEPQPSKSTENKEQQPSKTAETKEQKPSKPAEQPKEVVESKPEKPTVKKSEEAKEPEAALPKATPEPTTKTAPETTSKPPAVKKKIVKKASVDKGESAKGEEDKNKSSTKSVIASSTTGSSSSLASSAGGKSGTKLDGESKSEAGAKPKFRARSDSCSSDASPTRIERRNSKVISQKTAELIQNLETKQSLGSSDGKPKKLVFPSLKVSDAKRAFEKPPKPVKEPSSPPVKKSPTEEKAKPDLTKTPEKPEGSELTVAKPKKSKSKSPSPIPDEAKSKSKATDKQTERKTVEVKEKEPELSDTKEPATKDAAKEKSTIGAKPTIAPKPTEKVKEAPKEQTEKPTTLSPSDNQVTPKQKSVSPKVQKKVLAKPAPPVSSPEPPSEMTVSDSLNTELDVTISEVPKKPAPKTLKKLKIPTPAPSPVPNPDQLVKPVLVDNGSGTPKQAVMLLHGRTTPPVKNSADLDTSLSTDPFFSQTESVSVSLPAEKVAKPAAKTQEKQQAAKKISSVISRIASSESAERIMNEDKKGKKMVKTEVEKFVNSPDNKVKNQRTEVSFPVAAAPSAERIIPIRFENDVAPSTPPTPTTTHPHINVIQQSNKTQSAPNISRMPIRKSVDASSSTLFSRQNSSDTESSIAPPPKPEPIRKSPREFIIPIKLETSGQTVTPRDDVSEASQSEDPFRIDSRLRSGRFGRHKRYSSLLSDSSLEEEPASTAAPTASASASTSRRSSAATTVPCHTRSHSQGDEPDTPSTPLGTFKKYRMRRAGNMPLDRSDSFSSAEEDEEDAFEVLTAESLFSSLLDRVRNLTKRINRDDAPTTNWQGPESPGFMFGSANPFREFMSRAPSETRSYTSTGPQGSYTMTRSFSREPSVTVTISTGPQWRRSLSRDMSGGSVFHSRGSSFSGADPMDSRSLPLGSSTRRTSFLSQRSEPHGISDSPLGSTYNPPTARPYGRTMSNTDYSSPSSVTLPFRRSVKTYDRPSVYGHSDYTDSYTPMSSTSSANYNTPSRSNSVMSRYTGSASNSVSSAGGISEPPYSRFSRSVSRARATPDTDVPRYRDLSASRQLDNPLLSSYRNSGESNGWVGGSNSSSVKTAAATAKMTTQEKMNNYQNYYQGLSQNPLRSYPESTSPTPFLETFTDNFASPNSAFARASPVYETSFVNNNQLNSSNNNTSINDSMDSNLSPSKIIRPVKPVSPNRSFTTRELSSPPMLVKPADPAPTNIPKWPNISIKTHRPVNVANFTEGNLNQNGQGDTVSSTPTPSRVNTTRSIPSIVNRAPVVENPINSVLPGSNPQTVTPPQLPQPPPSHISVATMRPQNPTTFRVLSPPATTNPTTPLQTEVPKTSPTGPPITGYPKIPRREGRATSVEKITRLLERKSMPRERVVSPPPQVSPSTPNHIEVIRTPEASSPSSTLTFKSEDETLDRSLNASPEKNFRNLSNSNSLQRIGKPKFLQNLEKKWERLTSPSPQTVREVEKPCKTKDEVSVSSSLPQDSSDESEAQTKPDSESMLLQRAVSPEKKLRSKFGASTVNYMLGKFKKFEENSSSGSKIPAGKPPVGSLSSSKIGRRVQSVYAGACSDSVLALPRETTPSRIITNGVTETEIIGQAPSKSRTSPRLERAAAVTNTASEAGIRANTLRDVPLDDSKQNSNLVRRPVSLGIFSGANSNAANNTNPSLIPRLNRTVTPQRTIPSCTSVDSEKTPINEFPTLPLEAPHIHIIPDAKISDDPDDLLTPTSFSDSFDSSSICSEKTEMSKSVLEDEESVSDRIFRKSFYPRFNSLDRKKSKSTPNNPRHYSAKVGKTPVRSSLSPCNNFPEGLSSSTVVKSVATAPTSPISTSTLSPIPPTCSSTPSPTTMGLTSKINKYNPNPLFKELITDDFKSEVGSKAEYSRRVTSKLSKLLKEIESDIGTSGATTSQSKDITNNLKNSLSADNYGSVNKNRKSLSPSPGRFIETRQSPSMERSNSIKNNTAGGLNNHFDSTGKNGKL